MNNPKDWPLVDPCDDGIRPAGAPDACFYCKQKVGEPHARGCVIVKKLVRFRLIFDVDIPVPHAWTKEEFVEYVPHDDDNYNFSDEVMEALDEARRSFPDPNPFVIEYVGVVDETPRRELREAD